MHNVDVSVEPLRMTEWEQGVARALADAGIRNVSDLHRLIDLRHPGLATQPTIHRYLYDTKKKRLEYAVVKAIAEALGLDSDYLYKALTLRMYPKGKDRSTRVLSHAAA